MNKDILTKEALEAIKDGSNKYGTHDGKPNRIIYIQDKLPKNPRRSFQHRPIDTIGSIVVHHSGSLKKKKYTAYDYAAWHILPANKGGRFGEHGAPGIAYHYVIDEIGQIFKTNNLSDIGWHAGNWKVNVDSIGIVLNGNFLKEEPGEEQLEALNWLIRELNYDLGANLNISGHKEVRKIATGCPGNLDIAKLRKTHKAKKVEK